MAEYIFFNVKPAVIFVSTIERWNNRMVRLPNIHLSAAGTVSIQDCGQGGGIFPLVLIMRRGTLLHHFFDNNMLSTPEDRFAVLADGPRFYLKFQSSQQLRRLSTVQVLQLAVMPFHTTFIP